MKALLYFYTNWKEIDSARGTVPLALFLERSRKAI